MICHRCLARLQASQPCRRSLRRAVTNLANPRPAAGSDHEGPPAATSTGAAQPFSNPHTPSPEGQPPAAKAQRLQSALPAGTIMDALGYLKSKEAPVALEDHEYPDWLWTLLDRKGADDEIAAAGGSGGDAYGMLLESVCT